MSIPKEPRQLMINLMYLVLTALLALNVSAEIINAFFSLDKGLRKSSEIVEGANDKVLMAISKQADAYKSVENDKFKVASTKARAIVADFNLFVDMVRDSVFNAAGGPDDEDPTKPKRKKDKDVTTRVLVEGIKGDPGLGLLLEAKINSTRDSLLALIRDDTARIAFSKGLPLKVEDIPDDSKKKTWVDYKFLQMPVAAVFPILSKMQNDAKTSETAILNYIYEKISGEDIKFDAFEPVISATKGYIIEGERYEAEVFLSAYSTTASGNMSISVNGNSLPVREGKAKYEASGSSIGTKKFKARICVENPLTKKTDCYEKEFAYEVGRRSATVSADKMNVFYIGVDNPVSVAAAGISSNELNVNASGGGIRMTRVGGGEGKYNVTVETPGDANITLSGGGLQPTTYAFRVKRIPDPVAFLGRDKSGQMGTGEFKAQEGIRAVLENFDFDARCDIQSFEIARVPKRADPIIEQNSGGRYSDKASAMVRAATPGDIYYFDEIKARCPGDKAGRKINSMVFRIR